MDTVSEMIEQINKRFPTLPYFYDGDDGLWHFVYLGGNKRGAAENLPYSYVHKHLFFLLCELYQNLPLTVNGTAFAARTFKKLTASCTSRREGIYTVEEQERYLRSLSESELEQISGQFKMYVFFREVYKEYYRKPKRSNETTK